MLPICKLVRMEEQIITKITSRIMIMSFYGKPWLFKLRLDIEFANL